jgi:hypothetical protein
MLGRLSHAARPLLGVVCRLLWYTGQTIRRGERPQRWAMTGCRMHAVDPARQPIYKRSPVQAPCGREDAREGEKPNYHSS